MRPLTTASVTLIILGCADAVLAQAPARCSELADPTARLACYDRLNPPAPAQAPAAVPPAAGRDRGPAANRAFDPSAQRVTMQHIGEVSPPLRRVGSVPIASGPGSPVSLVTLDPPALRPVPGARWELSLRLSNNSARALDVRLQCMFRNGDRPVADVTVVMRGVGPGDQVATETSGPPVTDFVDNALCNVLSPL